jgi:uncharacterized protein YcbX
LFDPFHEATGLRHPSIGDGATLPIIDGCSIDLAQEGDVMQVETIYRYPVKTLTGEGLASTLLHPDGAIAGDRIFAIAQADCGFDEATPSWRSKRELVCLARNPDAMSLDARYDEVADTLTLRAADGGVIEASPASPDGRAMLESFIAQAIPGALRGTPRLIRAPEIHFTDQSRKLISLIGLPSLRALEQTVGAARDPLRFRANIYLEGLEPWAEFDWVGRRLRLGAAVIEVVERIDRCAATGLNPVTRQRDANPVQELMRHFGHADCGVFARVVIGGAVAPGDAVIVQ